VGEEGTRQGGEDVPDPARPLWRVGWHGDPIGFAPTPQWNHRFDDARHRFRTVYCAALAETALRELLADYRPNAAAIAEFVDVFGPGAADDLPAAPVTAEWRRTFVLAPVHLRLTGPIVDLTDHETVHALEQRHARLLREHGLAHLDLHEITTRRRVVTQAIATDVHDRLGAAAIRFPSSRDGLQCFAVFEGRGRLVAVGPPTPLTDPPPRALVTVCAEWDLALEPAPPTGFAEP
jgi:hypothetical protein